QGALELGRQRLQRAELVRAVGAQPGRCEIELEGIVEGHGAQPIQRQRRRKVVVFVAMLPAASAARRRSLTRPCGWLGSASARTAGVRACSARRAGRSALRPSVARSSAVQASLQLTRTRNRPRRRPSALSLSLGGVWSATVPPAPPPAAG